MTRPRLVAVLVVALACGTAAMGGAAATLGVQSSTIDTFAGALPASTTTTTAPPTDVLAPALVSLEMFDVNGNGKVDQARATFSEVLAAYSAGAAPWTLANVPSGGNLASVAVSGTTVTLAILEGAGAANTAVGAFTVALAPHGSGVRDLAGNRSSFGATAPADRAAPVLLSVTDSDTTGTANGKIEQGDFVDFSFSEGLRSSGIPSTTTVEAFDLEGGGNDGDLLRIGGVLAGDNRLGGMDYVDKNNRLASFTGTVALIGTNTIRVTLTGACSGHCADLNTSSGTATFTFVSSITGSDGLGVLGGSFTIAFM